MMKRNDCGMEDRQSVSDGSLESLEAEENSGPECFLVRRLSSRTLQLPPLAFRQAEQFDWKENDQIPRPTTLALNMPPLIAITLAESNRSANESHASFKTLLCHNGNQELHQSFS